MLYLNIQKKWKKLIEKVSRKIQNIIYILSNSSDFNILIALDS